MKTPIVTLSSAGLDPSAFADLASSFERSEKHHVKLIVLCSSRAGTRQPRAIMIVRLTTRPAR